MNGFAITQPTLTLAISIPLLYVLLIIAGRYLKRTHNVRFGALFQLFALCVAVYLPTALMGIMYPLRRELLAVTILLGTLSGIAVLRRFVWERMFRERPRNDVPRMLREMISLLIVVAAVLVVLTFVYEIKVPGLLAGSGIIAVILGLAMQDLLGNLFAGCALHFEKPFRVGDWLEFEGRFAEVMEINWRATRLRTNDHIYLDVPNRHLAREPISNMHYPDARHAMRLSLNIEDNAPPSKVKDTLLHAASNAPGVLAEPPPKVFFKNFGDASVEYEIKFWIDDQAAYNQITDAIRSNIWYELRREGIRMAVGRSVQIVRPAGRGPADRMAVAREALSQQPLFLDLDGHELDTLIAGARAMWYGRGERLISQGEKGDSMFVLIHGEARVAVDRGQGPKQVATLRAGECFGEMSLLTGESRAATVTARQDCEVLEIHKPALGGILKHNPTLMQRLSAILATRQLENEKVLGRAAADAVPAERESEYRQAFLKRLQAFFQLQSVWQHVDALAWQRGS